MKYVFFLIGLALAIVVGFWGGILRQNRWRSLLAVLLISAGIIGGLYPPIVGTFRDALIEMKGTHAPTINVLIPTGSISVENDSLLRCRDAAGSVVTVGFHGDFNAVMAMSKQKPTIAHSKPMSHDFFVVTAISPAPSIMLPYIPGLGERARILYFHVPAAWTGFFAYIVTMIFSIRYLRRNNDSDDAIASASAATGTLFTALAYISGAIWAKFNWGNFFNWDTRELSVLLLLAIYIAYFVLRANIRTHSQKRVAATYAIVAAVAALFLVFIVPRITISLHPGSRDDTNIGPVLSPEQDALDLTKAAVFSIMLSGFTLLYTWILNLIARYRIITGDLQGRS